MKNHECWGDKFQTPVPVADYMALLIPDGCGTVLEPTPGMGNLVEAIKRNGSYQIHAPVNFEDVPKGSRFDCVVMNPPFTPMAEGYRYLSEVMPLSDNIVALLPWLAIINSEKRLDAMVDFGLYAVTNLPRKTFPGSRIQCCVIELRKGYTGKTEFKTFKF